MHKTSKNAKPTAAPDVLAKREIAKVEFTLEHSGAQVVYLCGDFNEWSPTGLRMIRRSGNGLWEKRLALPPGRYEYKYLVDGVWTTDPKARQEVANAFGSTNSVLEVPA